MGTSLKLDLLSKARALHSRLVEMRRHIHSHPELSFEERETSRYAAGILADLGYLVREAGTTGLVAEIGHGRTVGIRADMDALPIQERSTSEYRSRRDGVMHACGHDAHTACALGAAILAADLHKSGALPGRIRFLFQPAEESVNAQGKSGAELMIDDGALEGLSALVGLHVWPSLPTGTIALKQGPFLAACDSFDIVVRGKGGHGAYPDATIDAVVLSSYVVQSLQTVISRRKSAIEPAVLTIGGIRSNTYRANIVAGEVELTGTVRYFDPALHEFFKAEIEKASSITRSLGGDYNLSYRNDSPVLLNDSATCQAVKRTTTELLGAENVVDIAHVELGAEDFAFYTREVPCCFFALGTRTGDDQTDVHTDRFDINEDALPIGAASLIGSALALLG